MYTIDYLETLKIQLGEIDYLIKEIFHNSRIDLKGKEIQQLKNVKECIKTATISTKTIIRTKNKREKQHQNLIKL